MVRNRDVEGQIWHCLCFIVVWAAENVALPTLVFPGADGIFAWRMNLHYTTLQITALHFVCFIL